MNDQGLSIFDDEPESGDNPDTERSTGAGKADVEDTQGIPVVQKAADPQPEQPPRRPVIPPSSASSPPAPAPSPSPSAPTSAGTPTFSVVKRNGYDRTAV